MIVSPDTYRENRIPPGQSRTRKWPVLHYGQVPDRFAQRLELEVLGLVERPLNSLGTNFWLLPQVAGLCRFPLRDAVVPTGQHLGRSRRPRIDRTRGHAADAHVRRAHGYDDGWTTNLPLADFLADDALLADPHDGDPSCRSRRPGARHGAAALRLEKRQVAQAIELVARDQPGLWERGGYHNHGDPWTEERFG